MTAPGPSDCSEPAIRRWLREGQPCLFGRAAARDGRLTVRVVEPGPGGAGGAAVARRVAAIRSAWRRDMLAGRSLGLVLVVTGASIRALGRDGGLAALASRLVSAFAGRHVAVGEVVLEDVYWPHPGGRHAWRWRVPVNTFLSGVHGSWAHARYAPGGVALVVNSVAQFALATRPVPGGPGSDSARPAGEGWTLPFGGVLVRMSRRTIDNCWPSPRRDLPELPASGEAAGPGSGPRWRGPPSGEHFYCDYDVDAAVPRELFWPQPEGRATRTYRFTSAYGQRPAVGGKGGAWPAAGGGGDPQAASWQDSDERACELGDLVALETLRGTLGAASRPDGSSPL